MAEARIDDATTSASKVRAQPFVSGALHRKRRKCAMLVAAHHSEIAGVSL
jgi:hypothetical protein